MRRDGRNHSSPNSGIPEAAAAGALGVRLGGTNWYFGKPVAKPTIGDPCQPLDPAAYRGVDYMESKYAAAQLVKLRYFAGFTNLEAAEILGSSARKASQLWSYARTWLLAEIEER